MGQCVVGNISDDALERKYRVGERIGKGKWGQLYEGIRRKDGEGVTIEDIVMNRGSASHQEKVKKKIKQMRRVLNNQKNSGMNSLYKRERNSSRSSGTVSENDASNKHLSRYVSRSQGRSKRQSRQGMLEEKKESDERSETKPEPDEVLEIIETNKKHTYIIRNAFQAAVETRSKDEFVRKWKSDSIKKLYALREDIGTGQYGVVKRAWRKKDRFPVAVKIIDKSVLSRELKEVVMKEIDLLRVIKHRYVVTTYEVLDTPQFIYIVMELLKGGELHMHINTKFTFPEKTVARLIRQLAEALRYLHEEKRIIHRDIKPENVVFATIRDGGTVKLTDFGLATYVKDRPTQPCGTPSYVAPEVIREEQYGTAVDMWSLGIVMYILLCGYAPFRSKKVNHLFEKIKAGRLQFPEEDWHYIGADAKHLIYHLLQVDAKKRLTAQEVLVHPFIINRERDNILPRAPSAQFTSVMDMPAMDDL